MADHPMTIPTIRIPALREGRMTQMRMLLDPQPPEGSQFRGIYAPGLSAVFGDIDNPREDDFSQRLYSIRDRLWVQEEWTATQHGNPVYRGDATDQSGIRWSSITPGDPEGEVLWRSPVTMPRWASRITLVVNDVRVQRVQEISSRDVLAEGVEQDRDMLMAISPSQSDLSQRECFHRAHTQPFRTIWNTLHGPDAWDRNDWVCAISFDVHLCNIDQMPSIAGRD